MSSDQDSEDDQSALDPESILPGDTKRSRSMCDSDSSRPSITTVLPESKLKEDAIWADFMQSVEKPVNNTQARPNMETIVKTYQFAGSTVKVTESIATNSPSSSSQITAGANRPFAASTITRSSTTSSTISSSPLVSASSANGLTVSSVIGRKPTSSQRNGGGLVSSALANLHQTLGKQRSKTTSSILTPSGITTNATPKLSTLAKSRLDWQTFVDNEELNDELKAHNKGKQGYLERQAFVNRVSEREDMAAKKTISRSRR